MEVTGNIFVRIVHPTISEFMPILNLFDIDRLDNDEDESKSSD